MLRKARTLICFLLVLCFAFFELPAAAADRYGSRTDVSMCEGTLKAASAENPAGALTGNPAESPADDSFRESSLSENNHQPDAFTDDPETGEIKGLDSIRHFFQKPVHLMNRDVPTWVLSSAIAAVLILILLSVLLVLRKTRKTNNGMKQLHTNDLTEQNAYIAVRDDLPEGEESGGILNIEDEPTIDLTTSTAGGVMPSEDEPTMKPGGVSYILKIRMIYSDLYMDKEITLKEGDSAVIGRDTAADFCTNPDDASVSHRHGRFAVIDGRLSYTDTSRNGTRYNGERIIRSDETVDIPVNTRIQLETGTHKVLVFAVLNRN